MKPAIVVAAALSSLITSLPAAAVPYEGFWSADPRDCRRGGDFLGRGQTLIVEGSSIRSGTLQCEMRTVIGTTRDRMDMSCRGRGRAEHRRVLTINADLKNLVIDPMTGEGAITYHRCGRPPAVVQGRGARAVAIRLENQGERLLEAGDYVQAEVLFTKALKTDPEYGSAFNNRGFAKRLLGRYADAIEDYNEAIRLEGPIAIYYSNRGVAYDALNKLHMAFSDFDKAVELDPNAPTALNGRGNVLRQLGRIDKAIVDLEKAVRTDPTYVVALNNLAMAYRAKGDRFRAIGLFNKALAIEPTNVFALKEKAAT